MPRKERETVNKLRIHEWKEFPADRVCDLMREQPQLVPSCPDSVWRKFKLGLWAKLIREPNKNSNYPVISSHEGRLAVVDKMKELGVAVRVTGSNDAVVVEGFEWCCLFLGRGSRFASDITKHIQWLAALAADFAAMAAEAAVSAPEYAEEYSIIAQAAAYETRVLMPGMQKSPSVHSTLNGSGCIHSPTGKHEK